MSSDHLVYPVFPGGLTALQEYMTNNKRAVQSKVPTVFVEFVIDTDGNVVDKECVVLRGGGMEADLEAVRLITEMPTWKPGTRSGQPAPIKMVLPIDFPVANQFVTH